jgi:predicted Zn-dependent peptidase
MTADMLDEGAGGRDALALADSIDFLGARLASAATWDHTTVRLHVPVARLTEALPLMADVALRPDFPKPELARLRKQALTRLLQARDAPRQVAARTLAQVVFGKSHRYGLPISGDAAALEALAVSDLRAHHARYFAPGNAVLVVVGDVTKEVLPLLEGAFGAWSSGGSVPDTLAEPRQVEGRGIWLVDKPGAPQSVVQIGRVGPGRRTSDYHALMVMNTLLGGSFTSRLNDNLREQHGYTYGASSRFGFRRVAGLFQAGADVQTAVTAESVSELMKELARIGQPPTEEEAERARNYLALRYAERFETTRQIAARLVERTVYDLPEDFFDGFVPKALAVDGGEMSRVAAAHIDPENLAIVVVGDRQTVEAPLRALDLGPIQTLTVEEVLGPPPRIE